MGKVLSQAVRRIFVEKRPGFDIEAESLCHDFRDNLRIEGLEKVRVINRYDVSGISEAEYASACKTIFSEPNVDHVYEEEFPIEDTERFFVMEYLPGQFDQRADSAAQCVQILTQKERPNILSAKVIVLEGKIGDLELQKIKDYCINPVESREASIEKPLNLEFASETPADVEILHGFINSSPEELESFLQDKGLAMTFEDLQFCQTYFKETEQRDPTITEIKVIDTYWSDHCRHTTFFTKIEEVSFEEGQFSKPIQEAYQQYLSSRNFVYEDNSKDICLMDVALMGMKELKKQGKLADLDVSDEINACSIVVPVDVNGENQEWLVMFKNETHNHPTEIEPFGGAATCLGGAIRDPLSGRSYVYQAMRVTGSGDPRTRIEETLPGKLPQRKITTGAAEGYSSYGNQIGLATGQVAEIYDEGFLAKRMEVGAVIAAAPKKNVIRETPQAGDVIILVGGRTGRDGCGGATGSSKEHDEESILTCGAEVQKGNPPTERKIQRLFRNPEVSTMIKKCNDFGAGGVSVAIGELTDGLEINLDVVPKKYEGLDGTELAISESQERMAVVVAKENIARFKELAYAENIEATEVAKVSANPRLRMLWRGNYIVDLSREFLNTNGVKQITEVRVATPETEANYFNQRARNEEGASVNLKKAWLKNLSDLNVCSQKGLVERFDSTIGAGTVLLPFGGKYQLTPAEGMVAKIPVGIAETSTATAMTFGYNPRLAKWSPFHGALFAVIEAAAKVVALGGDYRTIRLTLQEYFEKLGQDPIKWGKPFSALLGAYYAQSKLEIPAIGGKDSMSGTFKDLNVPPTLVAFAVDVVKANQVISPEFKKINSQVVLLSLPRNEFEIPDFKVLEENFTKVTTLIGEGKVLAAQTVRLGGLAETLSKMTFGNRIGVTLEKQFSAEELFAPNYGSFVLELSPEENLTAIFGDLAYQVIGKTQVKPLITVGEVKIAIDEALQSWGEPLESIFPTLVEAPSDNPKVSKWETRTGKKANINIAKPRIFIPVFPGTNCEYDSAKVFEQAGGIVDTFVFNNLTADAIEASIDAMAKRIANSQIIMIPGGFSGGDEPDGSGKFIATAFRNPKVKDAIMELLQNRDGLILGICNGFQALIKLGLVPYGEITDLSEESPTLTFNTLGRHVSCMVETKIVSTLSPWFNNVKAGEVHSIAVSHGEGRFVASEEVVAKLAENGQIATQYVDFDGNPSNDIRFNPNGSVYAVEGITSPDGRILGKMGHSERIGRHVAKNIFGDKDQKIFEAGVRYFK